MLEKRLLFFNLKNTDEIIFIVNNEIYSFKKEDIPEEFYNRKILNDVFVNGKLTINLV